MIFFKKLYLFIVIIKYKISIYNKLIYYLFCLSNNIYIKEIIKNTHLYLFLKIFLIIFKHFLLYFNNKNIKKY